MITSSFLVKILLGCFDQVEWSLRFYESNNSVWRKFVLEFFDSILIYFRSELYSGSEIAVSLVWEQLGVAVRDFYRKFKYEGILWS